MQFEIDRVYTGSAIVITGGGAEVVMTPFGGCPLVEEPVFLGTLSRSSFGHCVY
jgi:hypothetical protein